MKQFFSDVFAPLLLSGWDELPNTSTHPARLPQRAPHRQ
jgi:hypothetical protein